MSGDKSTGQIVGGIIGAVVGYVASGYNPYGAFYGYSIGAGLGGYIDPPSGPNLVGPRLTDLVAQTASYGTPVPRLYGTQTTYGNVIWLEGDEYRETPRKEKQGGKGGGGGATVTTYTYYATFGVSLCEGPIAGIKRLWLSDKLVYNASSDDIGTIVASNQNADGWVLYTGEDDQDADPREQADKGVDSTPRYPGVARIYFYDLELTDFGNTLQGVQVKAEIVTDVDVTVNEIETVRLGDFGTFEAPSCNYFSNGVATIYFPQWDNNYGNNLMLRVKRYPDRSVLSYFSAAKNGGLTKQGYSDVDAYLMNVNGAPQFHLPGLGTLLTGYDFCWVDGTNFSTIDHWVFVNRRFFVLNGTAQRVGRLIGQKVTTTTSAVAYEVGVTNCRAIAANDDGSEVYVLTPSGVTVLDGDDLSTLDTFSLSYASPGIAGVTECRMQYEKGLLYIIYHGTAPKDLMIVNATDGSIVSELTDGIPYDVDLVRCFLINNGVAFLNQGSGSDWNGHYFNIDFNTDNTQALSEIVQTEMLLSNLIEVSDIDVSDLTDSVRGFRVPGIMSLRSAISPLQGAFQFDLIPSGYTIKCVPRGGSSVTNIDSGDLDARAFGDTAGVALSRRQEMDSQLPRKVLVRHFDSERNGDLNEHYSPERIGSSAVNIREFEMPLTLSQSEAAQIAEILWSASWLERYRFGPINLPPTFLSLEPGDVVTLTTDKATYTLRLSNISYTASGRVICEEARINSASVWTSVAVGGDVANSNDVVSLTGSATTVLLDVPMMRDSDDGPGFGAGMGSSFAGWKGGVLFRSLDNEQTWSDVQSFTGSVPIGTARDALPADNGYVIDNTNSLTVDLISGSLSSITQAQMLTSLHWCAYGTNGRWELMRYITATLQSDGSYVLTGLLRGCRGTEWATGMHAVSDTFVFLDDSDMAVIGASLSIVGVVAYYRGVSIGQDVADLSSEAFTYNGVNLKPLSPVLVSGSTNNQDWTFTWTRRSRFTSSIWTTGTDYILGETAEQYEVDVMDGATVVRTITVTSESAGYSGAEQTTDFGQVKSVIEINVYQISESVGRGYAANATLVSSGDIYADFVVSLLNFNGADASTTFTDEVGNSWSASGNAQIDTDIKKYGSGSLLLDGAGDYISTPWDADFDINSGAFTIELWVYPLATPNNGVAIIAEEYTGGADDIAFAIGFSSAVGGTTGSNLWFGFYDGAWFGQTGGSALSTGQWYHIAAVGDGSQIRVYLDGTLDTTYNTSYTLPAGSTNLFLGRRWDTAGPNNYFNGHIDDLRITVGAARYTADFTPPTTELTLT